jgi:hypothetical protein
MSPSRSIKISLVKFFLSSSGIKFIIFEKLGEIGCSSFAASKRLEIASFKICSLG